MKIAYVANIRFPTEKAHGIQIAKTCEALSKRADNTLFATDRPTSILGDAFSYYKVAHPFPVERVRVPDVVRTRLGFFFESLVFALRARRAVRAADPDVIYGRDEFTLWLLSFGKVPVVWESHTGSWNFFARQLLKRAKKIVVISDGLKKFYLGRGVSEGALCVAHDGVDAAALCSPLSKEEARRILGLSPSATLAVYTGSRQRGKGVDTFEAAGPFLPGVDMLVVSGRPHEEMPLYMRAADVLVAPNSAKYTVWSSFTSPLKLFEYMASGTPVAASDVPALREVLDEESCYFFTPDSPQSLAQTITSLLSDPEASAKARRAKEKVKGYSWDARAGVILEALNHACKK